MTKLAWRETGSLVFERGVDHGVLYPTTGEGVPWDGLKSVTENVSGGEVESYYYDGTKYKDYVMSEDFAATIEAYAAPMEFSACDGSRQIAAGLFATQQPRLPFGFSYRTLVGNDVDEDAGYKLHIVYNCMVAPTERLRQTKGESTDLTTMSWAVSSVPPAAANNYKPTAHFVIDSRFTGAWYGGPSVVYKIQQLEDILYGTVAANPRLPTQAEVIAILDEFGP